MNNKLLFTAGLFGLIGAGAISATSVWAQTTSVTPTPGVMKFERPMTDLVEKISTKFNLDKADVQAVFDEARQEDMAQFKAAAEAHLTQLVTDGTITEAQKQLIIAKRQELQATHESRAETMKNLSGEEHRAAMEAERASLEAWAKQNAIPFEYVMPFGRGKGPAGDHVFIMKKSPLAE